MALMACVAPVLDEGHLCIGITKDMVPLYVNGRVKHVRRRVCHDRTQYVADILWEKIS